MSGPIHGYTRILTPLVVACVMAAFAAQPAGAQTAKKLKCNGCVKSKQIKNGQVRNTDLGSGAVTSNKISTGAVTSDKIADDAVTGQKIEDGAVGFGKLDSATQQRITDLEVPAPVFPASIVSESAQSATVSITNVTFGDGRTVIGTCSPGGTVDLEFDWSWTPSGTNLQQVNVGFVGGDTRCVASGFSGGDTGFSSLNLTCPAEPGFHQLGVRRTFCFGCPPACGAGGPHDLPSDITPGYGVTAGGAAFVGVVTVK